MTFVRRWVFVAVLSAVWASLAVTASASDTPPIYVCDGSHRASSTHAARPPDIAPDLALRGGSTIDDLARRSYDHLANLASASARLGDQALAPQAVLRPPSVGSTKLQNIIDDLYKGTTNPGRVGTGTTADAIRGTSCVLVSRSSDGPTSRRARTTCGDSRTG